MFSYQDDSHQAIGPLPVEEVRRLVGEGVIKRHTLLRGEGVGFWQPAGKWPELVELFNTIDGLTAVPGLAPLAEPAAPAVDVTAEVSSVPIDLTGEARTAASPPNGGSADDLAKPAAEPEPPHPPADGFFMVGGDGREYGPFTSGQLREWIAQRRADAQTRIRRADGKDWAPMSAWPEFAAAFEPPRKETSTPAPPPLSASEADKLAGEIIGRGISISVSDCFSRSWKLYTNNFGILTGTTLVFLLIMSTLNSLAGIGTIIAVALNGVLTAGLCLVYLNVLRHGKAEFNDLFAGFNRSFVPLLLAGIVTHVLIAAGLLLCLLPGIYLFVAWMFAYPLVIERSLDFWPAMELSRRVVHERWWELFALMFVVVVLLFVGILFFLIGVVFTLPIAFGAIIYAYEDIFGPARRAD